MKAILMSIRPKWVAKILNGEKTIEIRKKFPSDYVGWVYIYCTKARPYLVKSNGLVDNLAKEYDKNYIPEPKKFELYNFEDEGYSAEFYNFFNGKVVARFWCNKVDNYANGSKIAFENGTYIFGTNADFEAILKPSCLTEDELYDYCEDLSFKAIHITKLEIFDKPKEISEFMKTLDNFNGLDCFRCSKHRNCSFNRDKKCEKLKLTRAPQSFCFIEIE